MRTELGSAALGPQGSGYVGVRMSSGGDIGEA